MKKKDVDFDVENDIMFDHDASEEEIFRLEAVIHLIIDVVALAVLGALAYAAIHTFGWILGILCTIFLVLIVFSGR